MEYQYPEETEPISIPPPLPPISESSEHFKKLRDIHNTMDNLTINHTEDEGSSTDSGCDEEEEAALQEFRTWVKAQPHFVNCRTDNNFLLRFLRMRKLNLVLSQQVLDKYLTVRTHFPYCFHEMDVEEPGIRDLITKGYIFPLPKRDVHGRVVIFGVQAAMDLNNGIQKREDVFRTFVMTFEALLEDEENQKKGLTYIFDQSGINLSMIYQLGLRDIQRLFTVGEKAIPVRHKMIHWLYLPRYLKAIYDVFRTFLSPKLQTRLTIHDNLDTIPDEVPRSILPKEYGGEVPLAEMTAQWIEILKTKRKRIIDLDSMAVDESKRPKVKSNKYGFMRYVSHLVGFNTHVP